MRREARAYFLALPLLLYAALPTRNFYWDGVSFAINIEKRLPIRDLVHPSHLLYAVLGSGAYQLTGARVRALFVMQAVDAVFGAIAVWLLYRAVRQDGGSRAAATAASLLFAVSGAWWKYATDADAYIPAVCLLLAAWTLLRTESKWAWLAAALAHAGAMVLHELGILFLVVPLVALRRKPFRLGGYLALSLGPVLVAYVAAYRILLPDRRAGGLLHWAVSHAPDASFSFHPLANVALTLRGTLRLFLGGKLSDFRGDFVSWLAIFGFLGVALLLIFRATHPDEDKRQSRVPLILPELAWLFAYIVFLFFWMPQNTFYRLFYLPPLLLLAARYLPARVLGLTTAVLALWNFAFLIRPQSEPAYNPALAFASAQQARWPPGTPILFHTFHPDLWTISYFSQQASWISLTLGSAPELEHWLQYAKSQQKPLWIEAEAYEFAQTNPSARTWLAAHESPSELILYRRKGREFQFHCLR